MTQSAINEFDAAKIIVEALKGLDPEQQDRAIRFASESVGLRISAPLGAAATAPSAGRPVAEGVQTATENRNVDIKQFVDSKSPTSDQQFATVVAYFYRFTAPEELTHATQAAALLTQQADQLDATIEAERGKVKECETKLGKIWEGRLDEQFAREDLGRMIELAGRTRETMQVFLHRVTAQKIDRLSALITECFRFLLRKQSLVERIVIDPANFAITLYDQGGQAIPKERLSEGEKQIFAIAVLWGLARASARPLPAVIDTPMARLDTAHRTHLVERYFPNASHQVIIFSTDTEVDRTYYAALQPHIARAYHLNYNERERHTVGEEGYFWKD